MAGISEHRYSVTVAVEGRKLGVFDTFTGGEVDSDTSAYHPGAMAAQQAVGGIKTVNNFTVGRGYDVNRDGQHLGFLLDQAGVGAVVAGKQSLDRHGNPYGPALVYTGILKQVTLPDHDSESSDVAKFELEVQGRSVTAAA